MALGGMRAGLSIVNVLVNMELASSGRADGIESIAQYTYLQNQLIACFLVVLPRDPHEPLRGSHSYVQ